MTCTPGEVAHISTPHFPAFIQIPPVQLGASPDLPCQATAAAG